MNRKRFYNTEEDLQIIMEPGSDSGMSEVVGSDIEENVAAPQPRIREDDHPEPDFDILGCDHVVVDEVKPVDEGDVQGNTEDDHIEPTTDHIDVSKFDKHVPRWRCKAPPECNTEFLGKEFSLPPDDFDTWTPLSYFKLFWEDNLNELISEQTNLYSVQKKSKSISCTPGEIEQLIGVQMYMSVVDFPAYYMYWAIETRHAPIADVPIYRYKQLRENLHVRDNSKYDEATDISKFRSCS